MAQDRISVKNVVQLSIVRQNWKSIIVWFIHVLHVMSVVKALVRKRSLRFTIVLCILKFKSPIHHSRLRIAALQNSMTA